MSVLLVTYDLNRPGQSYTCIYEKLKDFPYAKLSESSWAIQTDKHPQAIWELLSPCLDANDSLFVITLSQPWWGRSKYPDVLPWLQAAL